MRPDFTNIDIMSAFTKAKSTEGVKTNFRTPENIDVKPFYSAEGASQYGTLKF